MHHKYEREAVKKSIANKTNYTLFGYAFTTSSQETEQAPFLHPQSPHDFIEMLIRYCRLALWFQFTNAEVELEHF